MPNLKYFFGVMGSSKTANALMTKFNYEEKGYKVVLIKPSLDNRYGITTVKSRIGLESTAIAFTKGDSILDWLLDLDYEPNCIIVDECQFLTKEQIEDLKFISDNYMDVLCYGLKTNFKSELFEGSKRLLEIADDIIEIESICACGRKCIINSKYDNGKIIYEGNEVDIGGNEKYIALCYRCWISGKIK